mgnify:CR=1 FL=1
MKIQLNGQSKEVADDTTVALLLDSLELTGKRVAVEVNEELVTRSLFDSHMLKADDQVEIVQAIGGG